MCVWPPVELPAARSASSLSHATQLFLRLHVPPPDCLQGSPPAQPAEATKADSPAQTPRGLVAGKGLQLSGAVVPSPAAPLLVRWLCAGPPACCVVSRWFICVLPADHTCLQPSQCLPWGRSDQHVCVHLPLRPALWQRSSGKGWGLPLRYPSLDGSPLPSARCSGSLPTSDRIRASQGGLVCPGVGCPGGCCGRSDATVVCHSSATACWL